MAVTIGATRLSVILTDNDSDGFADPGDVLLHTVIIGNSGDMDATGVTLDDTLLGSTETGDINISPIAFDDAYTAVGNTLLQVADSDPLFAGISTYVAGNLLDNDVNATSDGVTGFTITAETKATTQGGTVTINADGSFDYTAATSFEGDDTFTYTIQDAGLDGIAGNADDLTSTATVTITVNETVWYVDADNGSDATGDGTAANPFQTVNQLDGAGGVGDPDGADDYIYVQGAATGEIELENGQHLIGTGTALVVDGFTLATASSNSSLTGSTGYAVWLASGNEIAGIDILGVGGIFGVNFGTLTVNGANIDTSSIALGLVAGSLAGTGFGSIDSDGGDYNIYLDAVGGSTTATSGALTGSNGDAVSITSSTLTFSFGGSVTNTAANSFDISNSGNATLTFSGAISDTGSGIRMTNNQGTGSTSFTGSSKVLSTGTNAAVFLDNNDNHTINFSGGGLDIDTTTGTGFNATEGGTVTVTGIGSSINTTTGTGINFVNTTVGAGGLLFDSVSVNGATSGIKLTQIGSGNVTVTDGNLANVTERGVDIAGGSGNVTIGADISSTATGRTVEVTTHTGGTVAFSGAIDENGIGVRLENNVGATMNFTGGLDIDTAATSGTEEGFQATGGGTLNVTGAANSVNTSAGSGIAVNIANTTIGASGVTFQSVSANGATNGIVLNNTGTSGVFTVAGDGSSDQNGSGGTIQNTSGDGISLTGVTNVTFNNIDVTNSADNGLYGNGVNGLIINHSRFTNNANTASPDEAGIRIYELRGDATHLTQFNNIRVTDSFENNVHIINTGGTLTNLAVTSSVFENDGSSGQAGSNFVFEAGAGGFTGEPDMTLTVNGSTFDGNQTVGALTAFGLVADAADGTVKVKVGTTTANTFIDNNVGVGVSISGNGSANFDIRNNTFNGSQSNAINLFSNASTSVSSTLSGLIVGNTIGTLNTPGSGSALGSGIRLGNEGANTATLQIDSNTIQEVTNFEGIVLSDTVVAGTMNLTVTNNTVREIDFDRGLVVQSLIGGTANTTISGNSFSNIGGVSDLRLRATNSSSVNVLQASPTGATIPTEIDDANGGASLTISESTGGTVNFNSGITPSLPAAFLMAARLPTVSTEEAGTTTAVGSEHVTPLAVQDDRSESSDEPLNSGTRLSISEPNEMTSTVVTDDGILTDAELALIVDATIARWETAGATADQLAAMRAVSFDVTDLGGRFLGQSAAGSVTLDDNAAGFAWFVDATPDDDAEFADVDGQLTGQSGAAAVRIDLLTTVMHELGHQIGLGDEASGDALMAGTIDPGLRRLPDAEAIMLASGEAVTGLAYLTSPIDIGTIAAGQTVTVQFTSTVDTHSPGVVPTYNNFSTVDGSNFTPVQSNTEVLGPNVTADLVLDSLSLGDLVYLDANGNGVFDTGDTGIDGIAVSLYVDADNNDEPDGAAIATDITAGGGLYQFDNLAPGNYIVGVDVSNFGSGQPLEGLAPAPSATDPDDDVDDDSNGLDDGAGGVRSKAITLAYNSEPDGNPGGAGDEDGDADADTNFTLDFGFADFNDAPTVTFNPAATTNVPLTVWDQPATLGSSANIGRVVRAENFSLLAATTLNTFTVSLVEDLFVGSNNGVFEGFSGTLGWAVYTNVGNLPGTLLFSGSDASPVLVDIGSIDLGVDVFEATIDLGGIALPAGDFFIALHEGDWLSPFDGSEIFWAISNGDISGVNSAFAPDETSPSYSGSSNNFAFSLAEAGLSATEQVPLDLKGVIEIDDPDSGAGQISVVVSVDYGILDITPGASGALVADSGTSAVTITGTLAQIQTMLAGGMNTVDYVANTDTPPAMATLTVSVDDEGNTGAGGSMQDMASIPIAITAVNDPPDGTDNTVLTSEDTAYVFSAADFGFTDPDGDLMSSVRIDTLTLPAGSSLQIDGADVTPGDVFVFGIGDLVFTPASDSNGASYASFTFSVYGNGLFDPVPNTMTIDVTPVNDAPSGTDKTVGTQEDTSYTFGVADFGFTDTDDSPADAFAAVVITTLPASGSLQLGGVAVGAGDTVSVASIMAGQLKFVPAANGNGAPYASFTFQVQDNGGIDNGGVDIDPTPNTMTINVASVNDLPVAPATNSVVTNEDTASAAVAIGASDVDGDVLTYSLKPGSEPSVGSVSFADGSFVYTPFGNVNGTDSFIILIDDGNGGVIEQAVSVTIAPVPDAPFAVDDTVAAAGPGLATSIPVATLLANDFDLDGDPLSLTSVSNATGGTVSLVSGTVVFTPTPGFVGEGGFDYAISSADGSASAHVTITGVVGGAVSPTNQPPSLAPVALVTTLEDIAVKLSVSASDPDGDVLAFTATDGAHGTVTGGSGGVFVYTPAAGYVGTDSFTVMVSDGKGGTANRTVDVTVLDLADTANWTVHAPDRHVSELGGTGLYMGTAGFQQVTVLDLPGLITFDSSAAITSLARLFIPGGTQTYGPIPGGSPSEVIGTNAAERISLAADANAVLDASFVRDNDTLVILGPSSDYAVASSVAGVIITSAAGAHIRIPAFASDGGVTLEFSDITLQLTTTDGETFQIGSQTIGTAPGLIGSGLAPEGLSPGALVYRGGDLIELAGDAADWRVVKTDGAALLTDGDTHVLIPLGATGVLVAFDDGPRTLALDPHTGTAMIGTQVLTEALTGVVAPAQAIALPGTGNPALEADLLLASGGEVTAGGTFAVTGTDGAEHVTMLHGMFTFDDSFGHGNDMLTFDAATGAFTVVRDSASAVLDSATLDAKIPGGASGTPLTFTNGTHDLVYLTDTDTMTLGTQIITNTAAPLIV